MSNNENDHSHTLNSIMATNLKSTREAFELTQDAFAAQLGISKKSLQRYEQEKRDIPQSVRFQVMLQFGRDISPSVELLEQVELLKAKDGVSGSWLDRIGGPRWKQFRAGIRAHRLSSFSPWAQHIMAGRDYLTLFLIGCFVGRLASNRPLFNASEFDLYSWTNLSLFFLVPLMSASIVPELPLAKAAARILTRRKPNM